LSKRRWNVNLQKVRVLIDGKVRRVRVSTKAIKSGWITRPPVRLRPPKEHILEPREVKAAVAEEEEPVSRFFSEESIVDRVFRKKQKPDEAETPSPETKPSTETTET